MDEVAVQFELFPVERPTPEQIVAAALAHEPVARFAMFSGGDDSLRTTHWLMNNVPGCEVLHINTGIGLEAARIFVRETCQREGWPLTEVRALEDCGQDYDKLVLKWGFPGPAGHKLMYNRLKERAVELIVRRRKVKRSDKVMLATGIRKDESQRRSGYGGREVNFVGAQMWVNPMYWVSQNEMVADLRRLGIPRNPVSRELGMSGECLCGAYAEKGELRMIRRIDPAVADRIERLQEEVRARGHCWNWEDRPPKERDDKLTVEMFSPMCVSCPKSAAA